MVGRLVAAIRKQGQRGMTTAEYAVGSVAVASGVGIIVTLVQQDWFRELLKAIIKALFESIMSYFQLK